MLSTVEKIRLQVSKRTEARKKSEFGQFFTPARTAMFLAGLFRKTGDGCKLLDAGAGVGSLSSAFLERCVSRDLEFDEISVTAYELDESLHVALHNSINAYNAKLPVSATLFGGDFIEAAVNSIQFGRDEFTHVILNPPYRKIKSRSRHRLLLRQVGIETVNLYSAFLALSILLTSPGGQIVAIIPRSFCNGPYYFPFRAFMLKHTAIRHIHLFESRDKAFRDDNVLQENVIIRLERGGRQGRVTVSTSLDDTFSDFASHKHPFDQIVLPDNPEKFIYVPTPANKETTGTSSTVYDSLGHSLGHSPADLGVQVSTGPVVDFRLRKHLRDTPRPDAVPLLYPVHFSNGGTNWPITGTKKPNAIHRNSETEKWLYPSGFYCVVRRFSSKEEKRRITASVVNPGAFNGVSALGFENHLNLFHDNKHGLPQALAYGLAAFLNTTEVDKNFRRFNGHTQVNATDLRLMKYPSRAVLIKFGKWAMKQKKLTQVMIDDKLRSLIT